jgi:alkylation response protein AidB-like acyl-CoA dehydrogenase
VADNPARQLRRSDRSLSADQGLVRSTFARFFEKRCPPAVVRAAEPLGFDRRLWEDLWETGAPLIGVAREHGGGGGDLVDLALVAAEYGRRLAPVPFVEHAATARLLAALGGDPAVFAMSPTVATLALHDGDAPQLIPAGAIATTIVTIGRAGLEVVMPDAPLAAVPNLGNAPVATLDPGMGRRRVLATGACAERAHRRAVAEWKVLTAAALVGLGEAVFETGVEYAKQRRAFGVAIGAFQAVSHALGDVAVDLEGARNLVWKAAWSAQHDDPIAPVATSRAWLHATRTANRAGAVTIHTLGGVGVTLESDAHRYFRRAKGWPLVAGDPSNDLERLVEVD